MSIDRGNAGKFSPAAAIFAIAAALAGAAWCYRSQPAPAIPPPASAPEVAVVSESQTVDSETIVTAPRSGGVDCGPQSDQRLALIAAHAGKLDADAAAADHASMQEPLDRALGPIESQQAERLADDFVARVQKHALDMKLKQDENERGAPSFGSETTAAR